VEILSIWFATRDPEIYTKQYWMCMISRPAEDNKSYEWRIMCQGDDPRRRFFAMVKWEKNDTRTSLTSLALAGIMQAKQFELLKALFKCQNAANDGGNPWIHFLTLKYTHCQFCQNYPKKVAKIKLILAKLAFATNYEAWVNPPCSGHG